MANRNNGFHYWDSARILWCSCTRYAKWVWTKVVTSRQNPSKRSSRSWGSFDDFSATIRSAVLLMSKLKMNCLMSVATSCWLWQISSLPSMMTMTLGVLLGPSSLNAHVRLTRVYSISEPPKFERLRFGLTTKPSITLRLFERFVNAFTIRVRLLSWTHEISNKTRSFWPTISRLG